MAAIDGQGNTKLSFAVPYPGGITYDSADGLLYVANESTGGVNVYDDLGNAQTVTGSWGGLTHLQPGVAIPNGP